MINTSLKGLMNYCITTKSLFCLVITLVIVMPACNWFGVKQTQNQQGSSVADSQNIRYNNLKLIYITGDEKQFKDAHIPGSVFMDVADIEEKTKDWPRDNEIITYCANYLCVSSKQAVEKLNQLGFTKAKAFEGGIAEWYQKSQHDGKMYPIAGSADALWLKRVEKPQEVENKKNLATVTAQELSNRLKEE